MYTESTTNFEEPVKLHRFTCSVFNYLSSYIKIGFYLCIIPFNISVDGKGDLHFQQYKLHQLACLILHTSSLYFGLTTSWNMLQATTFVHYYDSGKHVPGFYEKVLFVSVNVGIIIFVFNCWYRKCSAYKCMLQCAFQYAETDSKSNYSKHASLIVCSLLTLQIAATSYPEVMGYWKLIQFEFPLTGALNVLTVVQSIYYQTMFHIVVIQPFMMLTLIMHLLGQRFQKLISATIGSQKSTKMEGLDQLMEYYLDVKCLVDSLNNAFRETMTVVFLSMVPTLGFGLSSILSPTQFIPTLDCIRTVYILFTSYFCVLLAAHGSSQVQNFANCAFEQMWRNGSLKQGNSDGDNSRVFAIMTYVDSSCVAVGCTPFFGFTYKFIGSMTSTLITYTIIMVQFREGK